MVDKSTDHDLNDNLDVSKRKSLFKLGGLMAAPLVPVAGTAAVFPGSTDNTIENPGSTVENTMHTAEFIQDGDLQIKIIPGDNPTMRVTNTSEKLVILRTVRPGLVYAGEDTFDLNAALASSAYAIGVGRSRTIPIAKTRSTTAEPIMPAHYHNQPLKVAVVTLDTPDGRLVHSGRAIYS